MGNVLSANEGQAPARQAAIKAGLSNSVPCTTINKVCSSGLKAVSFAAQQIALGYANIVVAGGFESMSNVPHYLERNSSAAKIGHKQVNDGLVKDGLWDVYNDFHMGNAAELCAKEHQVGRKEQDDYAIASYQRADASIKANLFKDEIAPVKISGKKPTDPVVEVLVDEDVSKVNFSKIPSLRPVFQKDGTVTAANASNINDGAAALVLVSGKKAKELGIKVLAKVLSFADAAHEPEKFTTAPAKAVPLAISRAGLKASDIEFYEINEAFSVVALANMKLLNLTGENVNVLGGAVALGHPLGCSGARILCTLLNVLNQKNARIGCAGICNGGGGASAMVIERIV
jgi:acetyl-CoA C-acetyltransferase